MRALTKENLTAIEDLAFRSKRGERLYGDVLTFLSDCVDIDEEAYSKAQKAGAARAMSDAKHTNHNRAI